MTTAAPYTWAELDLSNAAHYRRQPGYLTTATANVEEAWRSVDALIDADAAPEMIARAEAHAHECEQIKREAWQRWDDEKAEQLRRLH